MQDESGKEISDDELYTIALDYLASACEHLFEIETAEGGMAAAVADFALKITTDMYRNRDPRLSEDWHYEQKLLAEGKIP